MPPRGAPIRAASGDGTVSARRGSGTTVSSTRSPPARPTRLGSPSRRTTIHITILPMRQACGSLPTMGRHGVRRMTDCLFCAAKASPSIRINERPYHVRLVVQRLPVRFLSNSIVVRRIERFLRVFLSILRRALFASLRQKAARSRARPSLFTPLRNNSASRTES